MNNINERLKAYEGSIAYQKKLGYYRDGKFWEYKDSLGYPTIGYGRLLPRTGMYPNGITETQADEFLEQDIQTAKNNLKVLQLSTPPDWEEFMIIMLFQLGLGGVKKFQKMLSALREKNYPEAVKQAKNSLWYKQTPKRVDQMIAALTNK